jgi:hypothetical protein
MFDARTRDRPRGPREDRTPLTDQAQHTLRADHVTAARELGTWLRALVSFFEPAHQPAAWAGRAETAAHDFSCETRVVRDVLFRCLQLIASPDAEETFGGLNLEAELLAGESPPPREAGRAPLRAGEGADALPALEEVLKDACALCDALLEAPSVRLGAWTGLGGMLTRALEQSAAAAELIDASAEPPGGVLSETLRSVADRVAPDELGEDVLAVFTIIALALERLRFVEDSLRGDAQLKRLLPIFSLVQADAAQVLDLIENRALGVEGLERAVRDTLDGTAYALRMELRKAFEHELSGVCELRQPLQVFSHTESAHGLLRDCLQQSAVALARCFDETVEGGQLFPVFRTKLEQSLALRHDLWQLVQHVRQAAPDPAAQTASLILSRLKAFEEGSLRLLMYKDREPFERFVEEAETAADPAELAAVLHRFEPFLETLFGQVNMRAVLADHPFDPHAEE